MRNERVWFVCAEDLVSDLGEVRQSVQKTQSSKGISAFTSARTTSITKVGLRRWIGSYSAAMARFVDQVEQMLG